MPTFTHRQILIAPLDWGLGHTARCIPLIRYIQALGHTPVIACNAMQSSFLKETLGNINTIHLPGYNITYSAWNRFMQSGLLAQLPGILRTINNEHKWLQQLSQEMHIDGIISDNRYGLYHPHIPSVILTHQLQVQTGLGSIMDHAVQKIHYRYLSRFHATWIPDAPGIPNLAGKLSHPAILPPGAKYIGLLSRFAGMEMPNAAANNLLVLLSGPEPQRSILSCILWRQVQGYDGKVIFIEGSNAATPPLDIPSHITYHKQLTGEALMPLLTDAGMVICRSGYSTLMDLVALRKKAIFIPTPGQTEQCCLARYMQEQGIFYSTGQNGFNLHSALKQAQQFPYNDLALQQSYTGYKKAIDQWLK